MGKYWVKLHTQVKGGGQYQGIFEFYDHIVWDALVKSQNPSFCVTLTLCSSDLMELPRLTGLWSVSS